MERNRCQEDRGIPEPARITAGEDMPRKPLDIRFTDYPVLFGKGARTLSCFRRGRGVGQRPTFLVDIFAVFKVRLSLFLWLSFS